MSAAEMYKQYARGAQAGGRASSSDAFVEDVPCNSPPPKQPAASSVPHTGSAAAFEVLPSDVVGKHRNFEVAGFEDPAAQHRTAAVQMIQQFPGDKRSLIEMLERYTINGRTSEQAVSAIRCMIVANRGTGMDLDLAAREFNGHCVTMGDTPGYRLLPRTYVEPPVNPCYVVREQPPQKYVLCEDNSHRMIHRSSGRANWTHRHSAMPF